MVNRLARLGITDRVRADQIHPDGSGKAQVKTLRSSCSPQTFPPSFSIVFLSLRAFPWTAISSSRTAWPLVRSRTASPGQKQDRSGLAGCLAQLAQRMPLIGRQPVFQKVNVVGHPGSCFRRLKLLPSN